MAALITLTAVPGHIEQHAGFSTKTVEIWGRELARTTKPVGTVHDVRDAVRTFGTALRAREPQSSFAILIVVHRGDRKPAGFDAGRRNNGFGQDDFLNVRDKCLGQADAPAAGTPVPPAAA